MALVHSVPEANGPTPIVTQIPRSKRVFKVIVLGDPNVGKTCLSFRFCNGRFPEKTEATIGVDFRERQITIDGELIKVQLWDTAGQERFRQSMTAHYYRNVNAVVFVYEVTKRKTFENLSNWIAECRRYGLDFAEIPAVLIGNKCDVEDPQRISTNDAQKFADQHGLPLFETSAKSDSQADHVESIFLTIVHKLKEAKNLNVRSAEEQKSIQNLQNSDQNRNPAADEGFCGC